MEKTKSSLTLPLWSPFAILFLGAWLIVAPGTFGYLGSSLGKSDLLCGLICLILGWQMRRNTSRSFICWISLLGIWLQFAPLVFRIPQATGYLNGTLVGVLLVFFSLILSSHRERRGGAIPKGWTYNPSAYVQRFPVILLTCICWFLARYLTAYQLGFIDSIWDPFFGSGTIEVITSKISRSIPIPDAGLGAFAYTLEFLLGCHGSSQRWRTAPWLVLSFGLLVIPVGLISILLIILQPLVVHAWCTICILTAIGMLIMIVLTIDEVIASLQLLRRGLKGGCRLWDLLWRGLEEGQEDDRHEILLSSPTKRLFGVLFLGCSLPWNLVLSTVLGIVLMLLPSWLHVTETLIDCDRIIGALVIVVSVISMAEVLRSARFFLWPLAAILFIEALFNSSGITFTLQPGIALILAALAFPRGKLKETYGFQRRRRFLRKSVD